MTAHLPKKLEHIATEDLLPYARNSRTHSPAQIDAVARSITAYGFTNPVLIRGQTIIAGHGRVMAAKQIGLEKVPAIRLDHLSESEARAYVIADNRLAELAGWDDAVLADELRLLKQDGLDLALTGWEGKELDELMFEPTVPKTDPDATPPVQEVARSQRGDVWTLGQHRIMCGDSTSASDVDVLLVGGLVDMVFTDPPYNVAYAGRGENNLGTIENDDMSDAKFMEFCRAFFDRYFSAMRDMAVIYVCHPDSRSGPKLAFEQTFAEKFKKSSTLIWCKQSAGMGWQDYRAQHEPMLYGWKDGKGSHFFCGDRTKTTVWNIGRDAPANYVHPTQKPVELPEEAINNSSRAGETVLDLFGGSGSTLIACEKTCRINRSMELDPKYVDVIVRRWQTYTGQRAVHAVTGQPFGD